MDRGVCGTVLEPGMLLFRASLIPAIRLADVNIVKTHAAHAVKVVVIFQVDQKHSIQL